MSIRNLMLGGVVSLALAGFASSPSYGQLLYPDEFNDLADLYAFQNPEQQLISSEVEDRYGNIVGTVRAVDTHVQGDPRIAVALAGRRPVWVSYPHLRFDVDRNLVVTDLSYGELSVMPTATY